MSFGLFFAGISLLSVASLVLLVWSLTVILTTPADAWKRAGASQILWVIVVVIMPLIGSLLFVTVGRKQLAGQPHSADSSR